MLRFYRHMLKLDLHCETDGFVEFHLGGNAYLSIGHATRTSVPGAEGDGVTLSWRVDDVHAAQSRLDRIGVETGPIEKRRGAEVACFHDPEGRRLELWSRTSKG